MAEFKAGDRVVKMSGTAAGKYGTVNSVSENGTLNVTFDGERLPRYCDPERCGQVATNAKFKVGDKVKFTVDGRMQVGTVLRVYGGPHDMYDVKVGASTLTLADTPMFAANAVELTNPNYKPEAGMKYLETHFEIFDPKVAKAMIEDARRKGVKVPPGVLEKARRAGLLANAARNARALNWNYRNSYQFFCVDPAMKAPCILSGWDYREDAKDDAEELKELNIPHKIVSRRFLEQIGIDPNVGASWKKNR